MLARLTDVRPVSPAALALCFVATLVASVLPARADDAAALSAQMLAKLEVDSLKHERRGDFDEAVQALKRAGYIHKRYDAREDYSEIWKVLKPLDVYGARVLVVSNEREGKFIGCCMENRTTILMEAAGDVGRLRDFAKANGCRLEYDEQSDQDFSKREAEETKSEVASRQICPIVLLDQSVAMSGRGPLSYDHRAGADGYRTEMVKTVGPRSSESHPHPCLSSIQARWPKPQPRRS